MRAFPKSLLVSATALFFLVTPALADDPAKPKAERKYDKSFVDEDLSKKDFSKKSMDNCNFENVNLTETNFQGASLKNCNFRGATLKNTKFDEADLTGSEFQDATVDRTSVYRAVLNKVNFDGLDLSTLYLSGNKVRGASFRNVQGMGPIYSCDFFEADLRGANFSKALEEKSGLAIFRKAKYDQFTRWHDGFDPKARGAVYEETKKESADPTEKPKNDSAAREAAFAKLDTNEDGILSGKETASCKDCDTNKDGEVTLAEFLAGK